MSSRSFKITLSSCSSPKKTPQSKAYHSFRPQNSIQSPVHSPSSSAKLETLTSPSSNNWTLQMSKEFENPHSDFMVQMNVQVVMLSAEVDRLNEINKSLLAERDLKASQRYQGETQKELYLKLINSYQEIENLNKIVDDLTSKKLHPDERLQNLLMDLTYWKKKVFELEPKVEDLETKVHNLEADKEKLNMELRARSNEVDLIPKRFSLQIKCLSNEHEHLRRQLEELQKPKRTLTSERKDSSKKPEEPLKNSASRMNTARESRMQPSNSVSSFVLESTRSESVSQPNKENFRIASPPNKKVSEYLAEAAHHQKSQKSLVDVQQSRDNTPTRVNPVVEDMRRENQSLKYEVDTLNRTIRDWNEEIERLRMKNSQLSQTVLNTSDGADDRIKYFLDEIETLNNAIIKKSKDNSALAEENRKLNFMVNDLNKLKIHNVQLTSEYDKLKVTTAAIIDEIEEMKYNFKVNGKPKA